VLELIARRFSYAEIAKLRHVSVHTVQTQIKNLYAKLAVHNKTEVEYEATRMGLLRHLGFADGRCCWVSLQQKFLI
jgi:DNA-binding NarL/FixJ family response regulator